MEPRHVIAATIAHDLQLPGVTFEGKTFRNIDVRFVGLFDAVKKKLDVNIPRGWATAFSTNVIAHYHLIHTYHDVCFDFPAEKEDDVYPTVKTLTETTEYFRPNPINPQQPQLATHSQVGRDPKSLEMMVTAARNAGVRI